MEVHLFPNRLIPFILGDKGSILKEIKSRCEAYIHVTPAGAVVDGDKREVTLRGDVEGISRAKEEIDSVLKSKGIEYENFKEEFSIPVKCGDLLRLFHIDRIQSKCGVSITIRPSDYQSITISNEPLVDVRLTGELNSIKEAKEEILEVLGDAAHLNRSQSKAREVDAETGFKRVMAQDGDMVEVHRFPSERMGLIVGKNRGTLIQIQSMSGAQLSVSEKDQIVDGDKREVTIKGNEVSISLAKSKIDSLFRGKGVIFDKFVEEFSIPVECNPLLHIEDRQIQRIKSETGAAITIRPSTHNEASFDVRLTGEMSRIQKAKEEILRVLEDAEYGNESELGSQVDQAGREVGFNRTTALDGDIVEVHRFPCDWMGMIVGKGGTIAREIQSLSGAQLSIAEKDQVVDGDKSEVTLKGDERAISLAKGKIDSIFREKSLIFDDFREIISIPTESAEELFGSRQLHEIQFLTGATINLQANPSAGGHRDCLLIGEFDCIRKAEEEIKRQLMNGRFGIQPGYWSERGRRRSSQSRLSRDGNTSSRLRSNQSRLSRDENVGPSGVTFGRGVKRERGGSCESIPSSNQNPEGSQHR